MYGVKQSLTSLYNPCGNVFCERFNCTLFGLLKTLKSEEKADWPSHLPALVFAYNATPHASTGYQPYQLMFGRRAPAPCDNWLGLRAYNDDKSITHVDWVDQQLELLLHANKCAQKNIKATNAKNRKAAGGKDLIIPVEIWSFFAIIPRDVIKFRIIIKIKSISLQGIMKIVMPISLSH